jgi:hypothetical protein
MSLPATLRLLLNGRRRQKVLDPQAERSRSAVLLGGLPEPAADATDRRGEVDWPTLAAAMDSLFMASGGTLGVRRFWLTPQDSLGGLAPIDVLPREGGQRLVEEAAHRASAEASALRAG